MHVISSIYLYIQFYLSYMHAYTKYALNLPENYLHNIVGNRNIKITSNVYGKSINFCNLIYSLMF